MSEWIAPFLVTWFAVTLPVVFAIGIVRSRRARGDRNA